YKVFQLSTNAPVHLPKMEMETRPEALNTAATVENNHVRVVVDKGTGCITSLFDKQANFENLTAGACGNQLQFFKDTPKDYDAWNIDPGTLDAAPSLIDHPDAVELVKTAEPGIRVTRHFQESKFVQTFSLSADGDMVD